METLKDIVKLICDIPKYIYYFFSALLNVTIRKILPPNKSLEGETILITGASSGIGQDLAYEFSSRTKSVTLVLWDINETGLLEITEKCRNLGAICYPYKVDLSNRDEVTRIAQKVLSEVGQVTILINNAGLSVSTPFLDTDPDVEEKVIRVNMMSHMWTIRAFLPGMINTGRGHLVSTVSGLSFFRWKNLSSYVASKYGLRGFLETLKLEMRQHPNNPNIKISAIYPAWIKTNMTTDQITWKPRYCFNKFVNPMESQYVAEKIIEGIIAEDEEIMIPSGMELTNIFYRLLPSQYIDNIEKLLYQKCKSSYNDNDSNKSNVYET